MVRALSDAGVKPDLTFGRYTLFSILHQSEKKWLALAIGSCHGFFFVILCALALAVGCRIGSLPLVLSRHRPLGVLCVGSTNNCCLELKC